MSAYTKNRKQNQHTRTQVRLSRSHYENLPDGLSIYDTIEPATEEILSLSATPIHQLQLLCILHSVAKKFHRGNAVKSWAYSVAFSNIGLLFSQESLGEEFKISKQKISSHSKKFIQQSRHYQGLLKRITPESYSKFIDEHYEKNSSNTRVEQFTNDIEKVFFLTLEAPKSRSGKTEVGIEIFRPGKRRCSLLKQHGCPANACDNVAAYFKSINVLEA